jgi:alpha-tubulin suppressor-like RCC1 family protein/lysophospholipase L1-like esterase
MDCRQHGRSLVVVSWSQRWLPTTLLLLCVTMLAATPGADAAPKSKPLVYVALGDSYSSGEGLDPFDVGTDTNGDTCHRSAKSYPAIVAKKHKVSSFTSYACSGARVSALYEPFKTERPQLLGLSPSVDLVTISIGGNDLDWSNTIFHCAQVHAGGPRKPIIWAGLADCDAILANGPALVESTINQLYYAYKQIRASAPNARVRVVPYPPIFPDRGPTNEPCVLGRRFGGFAIALSADRERAMNRVQTEFVDSITRAVDDIRLNFGGGDFFTADTTAAFGGYTTGHTIDCRDESRAKPWVNALRTDNRPTSFPTSRDELVAALKDMLVNTNGAFHPTVAGQKAMAQAVIDSLSLRADLAVATLTLPDGVVGTSYGATLQASGGTPPYAWRASRPLPPGLNLSAAGAISGTVSVPGSYPVPVNVTDAAGATNARTLTVVFGSVTPFITTTSLPNATVGVPYELALGVSGGRSPYAWTTESGNLPVGVTLSPAGILSGIPSGPGHTDVTIRVTDALNASAILTLNLVVEPAATPVNLAGVKQIDAGAYHTCARTTGAQIQCWGDNLYGQLGDGTTTDHTSATTVPGLTGVSQITAGTVDTCALLAAGTVRCWGYNGGGQLGDGTTTDRATPVDVVGLTNVTEITAGTQHTCALLGDGRVACWGFNEFGELGDGTSTLRQLTAVIVQGLSDVTHITAGADHTCALTRDGQVLCWGHNSFGELGDGTQTNRTTPVKVSGLSGVTQVAAGQEHTCARLANGQVSCWGLNEFGELGDGTTTNRQLPVTVSDLIGVVRIAAGGGAGPESRGFGHTCAVLASGQLRCWGFGGLGQLGDGTRTGRLIPATVAGVTNATQITLGSAHTCATVTEAEVRCWGYNGSGALGDGTFTDRLTAAPVVISR